MICVCRRKKNDTKIKEFLLWECVTVYGWRDGFIIYGLGSESVSVGVAECQIDR